MLTRWPRVFGTATTAASVAPRLWISQDALVEARRRLDAQARERGLPPIKGRKRAGTDHPQLDMLMPKEVWAEWLDWCESSAMESSTALRSLLHTYLLSGTEPRGVTRSKWVYGGRVLPVDRACREKCLVSGGAYRALRRRASRLNVPITAIARALVLDVLGGRIRRVTPVDARTMWDDPDKYWNPEASAR
jgi:hypothetical protein